MMMIIMMMIMMMMMMMMMVMMMIMVMITVKMMIMMIMMRMMRRMVVMLPRYIYRTTASLSLRLHSTHPFSSTLLIYHTYTQCILI